MSRISSSFTLWALLAMTAFLTGCANSQPKTAQTVVWPRSVMVSHEVKVHDAPRLATTSWRLGDDDARHHLLMAEVHQTMRRPDVARNDYEVMLREKGGTIDDIARREFIVALKKRHSFPFVLGGVPVTATDRESDLDPLPPVGELTSRERRPSTAQGVFELSVKSWGFRSDLPLGRKVQPTMTLEATLRDAHGQLIATATSTTAGRNLPSALPDTYINSPHAIAEGLALAAKVTSEDVLAKLEMERQKQMALAAQQNHK